MGRELVGNFPPFSAISGKRKMIQLKLHILCGGKSLIFEFPTALVKSKLTCFR
jgi:hypothetical protein